MHATNPDEPPAAAIANHAATDVSPVRRSRWLVVRWVLVAHFGACTGISGLMAVVVAAIDGWSVGTTGGRVEAIRQSVPEGAGMVVGLLASGVVGFVATRAWAACRGNQVITLSVRWSLLTTAGALLLGRSQ